MPHTRSREEIAKYYQAADVFLLPSLEETFGLMAAEAMACACCVVAYASGALPEWVSNGVTGILVERGQAEALTKALESVCALPRRAQEIGAQAADYAKQTLGFERHVDDLLDVAQGMLQKS